jgi:hypothetical protein
MADVAADVAPELTQATRRARRRTRNAEHEFASADQQSRHGSVDPTSTRLSTVSASSSLAGWCVAVSAPMGQVRTAACSVQLRPCTQPSRRVCAAVRCHQPDLRADTWI